jgi:hypothetical protein
VCARELSPESSVAIVVRYGRTLRWLPAYQQTDRPVRYRLASLAPAPASPNSPLQPIPEAEERIAVTRLVADLLQDKVPRTTAGPAPARYPVRAVWLQARLDEDGTNMILPTFGGPNHRTTEKVLAGLAVREDVLQRIAKGFRLMAQK